MPCDKKKLNNGRKNKKMTSATVKGFFGAYRFLSNFSPNGFWLDGAYWPTNEHFYQAMKTTDLHAQEMIRQSPFPGRAKRMGQLVVLRDDWETAKYHFMWVGLINKFTQDTALRKRLTDTHGAYLEETNTWGDTLWGVCNNVGVNHLGYMLMELRVFLSAYPCEL